MECPKCENEKLSKTNFKNVEIDTCSACNGMWFDLGELKALLKADGAEVVDGDASKVTEANNTKSKVECPKCHTEMVKMVDPGQPHIWLESCSVCYGTWLDGGEFKDLKEDTLLDRFKFFLTKPRN